MKKKLQILLALAAAVAGILCLSGRTPVYAAEPEGVITDGVWIGKIDVSGMTKEQAQKAVDDYMFDLSMTLFTIKGEKGSIRVTAKDMGVYADAGQAIEEAYAVGRYGNLIQRYKETSDLTNDNLKLDLKVGIDKQRTARLIYDNTGKLELTPKDADLIMEDGKFTYIPGQNGSRIQIVESVLMINDFIEKEWNGKNNELTLLSQKVKPRGTEEELARIKDVLGSFTTSFASSDAGRSQNLANGCSKLNGTLLYPGDELSVYKIVSPFTEENGYAIGGAYVNGATVESIGGGICQVSSTLYNAAIRAELDITMRYNHSMLVSYVDPSDDAAIAGTYKDMRFVNNLDIPIYIEGYCKNKKITFNIYGEETRPANREISFESETLSETDPGVEYQLNNKKALGYYHEDQSKHMGNKSQLWKVVTVDGVEQSREIFNKSTYRASVKIVSIGTAGATEEQLAQIKSAISTATETNNESVVKNLVKSMVDPGSVPSEENPGGNETPAAPAGGNETPAAPAGGNDAPAAPAGGNETPAAPAGGNETPAGGNETPNPPGEGSDTPDPQNPAEVTG